MEELLLETEWFVDRSSFIAETDLRDVDRFSSESDIRGTAAIVVDKLREVKDE